MKLIFIHAVWCSSCIVSRKVWKELKQEYPQFEYVDYDYDQNIEEIVPFSVGTIIPVLIFVDQTGKELKRLVGEISKKQVLAMFKSLGVI